MLKTFVSRTFATSPAITNKMAVPSLLPAQIFNHKNWLKDLEHKKYPAKQHVLNVKQHFLKKSSNFNPNEVFFFISGEHLTLYPYCDQSPPFRQNRYFYYLTGVNIPGSHVLFNLKDEKTTLFLPDIDNDDVMWSGMPMGLKEAQETFDVDEVKYSKDLEDILHNIATFGNNTILTTDLNAANNNYTQYLMPGNQDFFYALDESRLIKDEYELALMRHAAQITDNSHLATMSAVPIEENEGHIHAEFVYHSIRQGSKSQSYDPICCSGPNCGTLHYIKNDETIGNRESILIDAGAEWSCYASDVTRCWPVNGKWSAEHLEIYNIVLEMQAETMKLIKPGQSWEELHLLAHKIMIKRFLGLGIFENGTEEEIYASGISGSFFPHGLGHLLGMDTHDVGGYANYDDPNPLLKYLRLRRPLKAGMVVTDEPGVYFSPFLIEDGLKDPKKAKFVNQEVLEKYWKIGGVRIEDDIIITNDGYDNMTQITKDPQEISKIVMGGIQKGRSYFHVIV
ncbi:putative Xaa-Pro dipeptidase [Saccharomycopsis crataegensis]|uniref:Xaa-Pro dipeptidase n=1 Tax=Saccharomycopsis crataegensis TaxID=43959 RepID=A0AAV5QI64_9ASCO|nr:putative Xaa-Pro dipeptidase [Saccharomycopsis crataegensis]